MRISTTALGLGLAGYLLTGQALAQSNAVRPDQVAFRALYKELVETNTAISQGSCTLAAERMAARMKQAGFSDDEIVLFATPEKPKEGGMTAVLKGSDPALGPMLLLAHLDVVEAKREDWTRDPFTLIEEDGYLYARGSVDDKAQAAIWTDMLIRFRMDKYVPKRTIKLALTCGEETAIGAVNGAKWLTENRPELVSADFALNEGGGGQTDGDGRIIIQTLNVSEKAHEVFKVETTNPGGHSSIPIKDNAIYQLADALVKIREHEFALEMTDTTRAYLAKAGTTRHDAIGDAMIALAKNPKDKKAEAIINRDRQLHSLTRTTCVATMLDGGHANNALPQRAAANLSCRIFPGRTTEETRLELEKAIGDKGVRVAHIGPDRPMRISPPLDPKIVGPAEKLVAQYFPGVPLIPAMSTGATDGRYFGLIHVPVYGPPGIWGDPGGNGVHGLNERISIKSLYTGRDFLTDLVKLYANPS